jgi:transposase
VRHSIAADLALADHYEVIIGELELAVLRQARIHEPNALALLTSVPGIGKVLALTILYEIHDISRFPSVRDFASYSRLVKCERSSAGKSLGSGGNKIGNAYLKWAFSEAAVLFIAKSEQGRTVLTRLERKPDRDASPSRPSMSRRGRTGIVGTSTRQRSPLDWTPLSLHRLHRRHPLFFVVSAPHPSPPHTGSVLRHAHACNPS